MTDFTMPHGDLLVSAESQEWVESLLAQIALPETAEKVAAQMDLADSGDGFWSEGSRLRPYAVRGGVLTVPVKGVLMSGFPFAMGGMATGYEYIVAAVTRGVSDPEVQSIVLDVHSPGGTVTGCFDCADEIFALRGKKPIRAFANEFAYSAAYAIASSADSVAVARTGGVGSIGVMTAHRDLTQALAARGIKITPVFAGKQKVDGQPFVPLTDEAKARMQARVDALYDIFVSTVARNRGLDEALVRGTEAATFMATQAVENRLADTVGSLGSISANADPFSDYEDENMSNDNTAVAQAEHEAAVATATANATEAGKAAGVEAERARVSAILDSEEAKTHPAAARHVALKTDMSAEAAAAFLKGLPEEPKAAAPQAPQGNGFQAQMDGSDNPNLGAGSGGDDTSQMSTPDSIFASAGRPKAVA